MGQNVSQVSEPQQIVSVYGYDLTGISLVWIVPDLRPFAIPLNELNLDPANALQHDEEDLPQTRASLREFGQREPIIVNRNTMTIENGNGRWLCAKDLGWSHIAAVLVDDDNITAVRYAIATNATGRLAKWDWGVLLRLHDGLPEDKQSIPGLTADLLLEAREMLLSDDDDAEGDETDADRAASLAKLGITIEDPRHEVEPGDVWRLGDHLLICADVLTDWPTWTPFLEGDDTIFAPYPGVFTPLTVKAQTSRFVMVQPDPYVAGHILDRYADINGEQEVRRQ